MDVVVAGGHGKVGLALLGLLAAGGHRARGLIRDPTQAGDLEEVGAEAVVCDMEAEKDLDGFIAGADAVVFAAGAGPGSGAERKRTVDFGAAVKLIDAARTAGVKHYVMVSAIGAADMAREPGDMQPYFAAKADADAALTASGIGYTIVRPGALTDDPPTGLVQIAPQLERGGQVPRADVAAVVLAVLEAPATKDTVFDLVAGDLPVDHAIERGTG